METEITSARTQKPAQSDDRSIGDLLIDAIARSVVERIEFVRSRRKRLYSLDEAAEYLGLSPDSVRELAQQQKLKTVRPTKRLQFDIDDLDAFVEGLKLSTGTRVTDLI